MFVVGVVGVPLFALTKQGQLLLWSSVLIGVLLLGAAFIARLDRWRKRQMEAENDGPEHVMSFREMYECGELSKEEYDRVLRQVAEQVGAKPQALPVQPAANSQEPEPGPPTPLTSPTTEEPPTPPTAPAG